MKIERKWEWDRDVQRQRHKDNPCKDAWSERNIKSDSERQTHIDKDNPMKEDSRSKRDIERDIYYIYRD